MPQWSIKHYKFAGYNISSCVIVLHLFEIAGNFCKLLQPCDLFSILFIFTLLVLYLEHNDITVHRLFSLWWFTVLLEKIGPSKFFCKAEMKANGTLYLLILSRWSTNVYKLFCSPNSSSILIRVALLSCDCARIFDPWDPEYYSSVKSVLDGFYEY